MNKTIAIIGALDTKGGEFAFLKNEIEKRGCRTFVINVGVLGEPLFEPQVSAEQVALAPIVAIQPWFRYQHSNFSFFHIKSMPLSSNSNFVQIGV